MNLQFIYRNTLQSGSGTVRNPDGTPYNLTGKTVEFFLKKHGENEIVFYKTATNGSPATNGNYTVSFPRLTTVNILDGAYDFGIYVRDSNGDPIYAGGGQVTIASPGG